MIQNLKMLNRSNLISFGFSFMLLLSFKAEAESMIQILAPDTSLKRINLILKVYVNLKPLQISESLVLKIEQG